MHYSSSVRSLLNFLLKYNIHTENSINHKIRLDESQIGEFPESEHTCVSSTYIKKIGRQPVALSVSSHPLFFCIVLFKFHYCSLPRDEVNPAISKLESVPDSIFNSLKLRHWKFLLQAMQANAKHKGMAIWCLDTGNDPSVFLGFTKEDQISNFPALSEDMEWMAQHNSSSY